MVWGVALRFGHNFLNRFPEPKPPVLKPSLQAFARTLLSSSHVSDGTMKVRRRPGGKKIIHRLFGLSQPFSLRLHVPLQYVLTNIDLKAGRVVYTTWVVV